MAAKTQKESLNDHKERQLTAKKAKRLQKKKKKTKCPQRDAK